MGYPKALFRDLFCLFINHSNGPDMFRTPAPRQVMTRHRRAKHVVSVTMLSACSPTAVQPAASAPSTFGSANDVIASGRTRAAALTGYSLTSAPLVLASQCLTLSDSGRLALLDHWVDIIRSHSPHHHCDQIHLTPLPVESIMQVSHVFTLLWQLSEASFYIPQPFYLFNKHPAV